MFENEGAEDVFRFGRKIRDRMVENEGAPDWLRFVGKRIKKVNTFGGCESPKQRQNREKCETSGQCDTVRSNVWSGA